MVDMVAVNSICPEGRRGEDEEVLYIQKEKYVSILKQRYPSWYQVFTRRVDQSFDPFPGMAGISFPELIELLTAESPSSHSIMSVGGLYNVPDGTAVDIFQCGFRVEGTPGHETSWRRELWSLMSQNEVEHLERGGFNFHRRFMRQYWVDRLSALGFLIEPGLQTFSVPMMSAHKLNQVRQAHACLRSLEELTTEVNGLFDLMIGPSP